MKCDLECVDEVLENYKPVLSREKSAELQFLLDSTEYYVWESVRGPVTESIWHVINSVTESARDNANEI